MPKTTAIVATDMGYLTAPVIPVSMARFTDKEDEACRMEPGRATWFASQLRDLHARIVLFREQRISTTEEAEREKQ